MLWRMLGVARLRMTSAPLSALSRSYTNPVWDGGFGDPFILSHAGGYVAFGTGPVSGGRAIPTLISDDLVNWRGGEYAIALPNARPDAQVWAPEAIEYQGRFYLYYASISTIRSATTTRGTAFRWRLRIGRRGRTSMWAR